LSLCETHRFAADQKTDFAALNPSYVLKHAIERAPIIYARNAARLAWTTGTYTFIVNDKDGKSEQARGNWIDMLRQEGNEWKVIFQAYARTPC
jgi:hypothetical protein